jgi:hypothetical protein
MFVGSGTEVLFTVQNVTVMVLLFLTVSQSTVTVMRRYRLDHGQTGIILELPPV